MTITEHEAGIIKKFLREIAENGYWFPNEEVMRAIHSTVSMWAPEIVIARSSEEVLLTKYEGGIEEFKGKWHIPGGYNRWNETMEMTCSRVARREIGVDVRFVRVLDAHKWNDEHPYGHPLSLFVLCEPLSAIVENEAMRFFNGNNLPPLSYAHGSFLRKYFGVPI